VPAGGGPLNQGPVQQVLARLGDMPEWLRAAADGRRLGRALEARVPELATGGWVLTACEPKLRLKGGDRWTAAYRLDVVDGLGAEHSLRVVGEFESGRRSEREASITGELGRPGWRAELPALGLVLRAEPQDQGLPALADLVDPVRARMLLEESLDQAVPGVRVEGCAPEVMRYKPGSRCTVRYRVQYAPGPAGPGTIVAKTYRGNKGENAYLGMAALRRAGIPETVVTLAEPLAYRPELKVLLQGPVDERQTLKELVMETVASGPSGLSRLHEEVAKVADGLAAVHLSGVVHGGLVTWEHEWSDAVDVAGRVDRVAPEVAGAARPLLEALASLAREHSADPPGPAHRSFRPAQVLLADGRIAFIDFDGLCTAEPAMDVAMFRASLRDAGMRADGMRADPASIDAGQLVLDEVCDLFVERYRATNPISISRISLWESLYLLTAVLHCWTKVKPALLPRRMASLERLLASTASPFSSAVSPR
jgi:hypothetical protein